METETDLMRIMMEDYKPTKRIILQDDIQKIWIFSEYDFPLRLTKLSKIGTNMEYQSETKTLFCDNRTKLFLLVSLQGHSILEFFWNNPPSTSGSS